MWYIKNLKYALILYNNMSILKIGAVAYRTTPVDLISLLIFLSIFFFIYVYYTLFYLG